MTDDEIEACLPPVGALFPDMLRLLCRWRWYEGGVLVTGRPFRDEEKVAREESIARAMAEQVHFRTG